MITSKMIACNQVSILKYLSNCWKILIIVIYPRTAVAHKQISCADASRR